MSRIGLKPIPLPPGVSVTVRTGHVEVTGPRGTLSEHIFQRLTVEEEEGILYVRRPGNSQNLKAQHGLARSLIQNMVTGVTEGYTRVLEVHGDFYRASMRGKTLVLQVGKSHPVEYESTDLLSLDVDQGGRVITLQGISKSDVGQLAAVIRGERPPEPYGGAGIRYRGEQVRTKVRRTAA